MREKIDYKKEMLAMAKWFIPVVLGLLIFFSIICIAEGKDMDLTKAVIHHSVSPDWSVARINKIHVEERGFDEIGYHYLIRADGTVEKGRLMTKQGAHAKGRNHYVGICLTGYDKFTAQQVAALIRLLQTFKIKHIESHHEECPGPGLDMEYVRGKI